MQKKNKGITLVALVITIIILLILAGITINLTIGQRGILTRAQEAGRNYQEAARQEEEELRRISEEADNIITGINTPNSSSGDNYTMVDGVPVPIGFKHTEGTKETGFVIQDNTNGNEFVWIPCTEDGTNGSIKYDRYAFSREDWQLTQTKTGEEIKVPYFGEYVFTEDMSPIEINSIKKYGGFYIGRYETGIEDEIQDLTGYDKENYITPEKEWTGWRNGKAVVQKDKQVWNYITRDKAKIVAEGMYENNNAVTSRLCSSCAWDTTLKFIGGDYAINSIGDNYSGELKNTGIGSAPRNNIYDMGGNVVEWTTEVCSRGNGPCTVRGGSLYSSASEHPAGSRGYLGTNFAYDGIGFRSTLYVQ